MKDYEISKETLAIIPIGEKKSRVIEKNCSFEIEHSPNKIMDESCRYYGSSINGRQKGTSVFYTLQPSRVLAPHHNKQKSQHPNGYWLLWCAGRDSNP